MAQAAPAADRGPTVLASNNPFRTRVSPTALSPPAGPIRPTSTNPFLDASEMAAVPKTAPPNRQGSLSNTSPADHTIDIFASLNLQNSSAPLPLRNQHSPVGSDSRRENVVPNTRGPGHRQAPHASDEEPRRRPSRSRAPPKELDIFADPLSLEKTRSRDRRPRRNSESSVRDKPRDLDPEAEKRRRERKLRDEKDGRSSHRSKKPNRRLDVIDKLDVTSIYGTGLFHHDGPFDACNPHRNRKGARQAPMQAFPKGSANMALGGSGPVNSNLNLDQYHGRGMEAHDDYNEAVVVDADAEYLRRPQQEQNPAFNPTSRVDPVHGDPSAGLGTSTFLEGTPASRVAIQRREVEAEASQREEATGLSRTKSLAQRIKSVRPNKVNDGSRVTSPGPINTPTSPLGSGKPDQTGANPFFKDYDKEYDRKGAQIAFADEQDKAGRPRAPSSPKRAPGLERKNTGESATVEEPKGVAGGFLNRMKSMKGRSRTRERRNTETS
ncbi:hypothetical protein PV10_08918 [Exophiala mesophila]|uniref:Pal1 cell morphology protein n=1 Tax=Exophiala mesophila TaxID=212818 RepID=A0A0D1ZRD8_EXOME|nr:uncharacterized protein PV10_08918 [Exophiala mesophila]KIV89343.1 hypothetical protein PV10_08918 [Exophiala mesophila]